MTGTVWLQSGSGGGLKLLEHAPNNNTPKSTIARIVSTSFVHCVLLSYIREIAISTTFVYLCCFSPATTRLSCQT
uniref:Uncharacterized protein n=1 Tax=Escherichia coli TaxID=562 RepID=A0A2P9DXJ2_ECOLX|nr:protein of unknown function [Escherichia coli]